ncbi:hypothetical protein B0H16DRAFT_1509374, partial [Mycena metata]
MELLPADRGDTKFRETLDVPADIWNTLCNEYIEPAFLSRKDILGLQLLNKIWLEEFRPLIYEHINLRTYADAELLVLYTLPCREWLLEHIKTLSIGFPIPLSDTAITPLWTILRSQLPRMTRLQRVIVAFTHRDKEPLGRILDLLLQNVPLPPSLTLLHLRSSCQLIQEEKTLDGRPWLSERWPFDVAAIPSPITNFILSTPHYAFWPPTATQHNTMLQAWTRECREGSLGHRAYTAISTITVNHGYINDGRLAAFSKRIAKQNRARPKGTDPREGLGVDMEHANVEMEGFKGVRLDWKSLGEGKWRSMECAWLYPGGDYEMFGGEREEWKLGWKLDHIYEMRAFEQARISIRVAPHRDVA